MDTVEPRNILSGMLKFASALGLVVGTLGRLAQDRVPDAVLLADGQVVVGDIVDEAPDRVKVLTRGSELALDRGAIAGIRYGAEEGPPGWVPLIPPVRAARLETLAWSWYPHSMNSMERSIPFPPAKPELGAPLPRVEET